ncbi:MAG: pseudaminic acid synthase [Elusimicrobia bacterium]|nr:pseudaminic acid synthase [Elusimicrobiota bacterium]
MNDIKIGNRRIGEGHPPFIVAEMSGNHNQSLAKALALVDAAAVAGAHALKLQTFTADTMTIQSDAPPFRVDAENPLWDGENLYRLYQKAQTPWAWHMPIFQRAKKRGLVCFSSPFDSTAVDFLESLAAPCYKVASFENEDWPLLKRVAATRKPVIVSTGMTTKPILKDIVRALRTAGCKDIILLKCTSSYPAEPADSNLLTIPDMARVFKCHVGLSDHTMGIGASVAAVALGCRLIEKHFTLDRADGGVDSAFSLDPAELKMLVSGAKTAFEALGRVSYGISPGERHNVRYKRSIYVVADIEAGDVISQNNVRVIRPGQGLKPRYFDSVLGRRARKAVKRGTPLAWPMITGRPSS